MSPEQEEALKATRARQKSPVAVDGRSDVYSLGVLLYEALGGPFPLPNPLPRLETYHPQVSPGLADIVHKCLAPRPEDRYQTAAHLALDLRRHLTDLPLQGVANRSWRERWRKWRRRRPHAWSLLNLRVAALLAVTATIIVGLAYLADRRGEATRLLERGRQLRDNGQLDRAAEIFAHGQEAIAGVPLTDALSSELATELHRTYGEEAQARLHSARLLVHKDNYSAALAELELGQAAAQKLAADDTVRQDLSREQEHVRWAQKSGELHALVGAMRFQYGETSLPPQRKAWEEQCRKLWAGRQALLPPPPSAAADARRQVREDLLDLAILWSDLRARTKPLDQAGVEHALHVLHQAEHELGTSRALCREYQRSAELLGRKEEAASAASRAVKLPEPTGAWDLYALGRFLLRSGSFERGTKELREAVRHEPSNLWYNFYLGLGALQLGHFQDALGKGKPAQAAANRSFQDAVAAFTACVALEANDARIFNMRGLAWDALKRPERAIEDLNRALELDPKLVQALVNRGRLHLQRKHYDLARDDCRRAMGLGADPALIFYRLAQVDQAQGKWKEALDNLDRALQSNPQHAEAKKLKEQLKEKR
jgi:tetratricopeptide (TPR) repeat protein